MAKKSEISRAGAEAVYQVPQVANMRVLTVGKEGGTSLPKPATYFRNQGFKSDFRTISEAMDAIPLVKDVGTHNFTDRWIILVTPGYYEEEIRMKPFVTVVGLGHHSVFVQAPVYFGDRAAAAGATRSIVYLNHFSSIRNVVLGKRATSLPTDFAIWNKDLYGVSVSDERRNAGKVAPSDIGAWDVPIFPFIDRVHGAGPRGELNPGKAILLEGEFSTAFMVEVGSSYNGTEGYDFEIRGVRPDQNADCHIIDCFFDALFLPEGDLMKEKGGCLSVQNCLEVHVRNSLLRVGPDRDAEWTVPRPGSGQAPAVLPATHGNAIRVSNGAHVLIEGSTLGAPGSRSDQVLCVEDGSLAGMFHSSTDSLHGARNVYERSLPRNPDGSLRDGQT